MSGKRKQEGIEDEFGFVDIDYEDFTSEQETVSPFGRLTEEHTSKHNQEGFLIGPAPLPKPDSPFYEIFSP